MNTLAISRHLLWKDYRQLRPALIGCWAIMAVILLLTCVRQLVVADRERIFPDAIMLVLAAPTLAAMAASGITVGHERQTRTWNWSSSLPISWTSSLLSKFIVWLVSSAIMVGTLYALYRLLLQLCLMQGMSRQLPAEWISPQVVIATVLIVPIIAYLWFSIAALLWNDTLSAFVGTAILVSVLYIILTEFLPRYILSSRTVGPDASFSALGLWLQLLFLVVVPVFFMLRAYRWRWTTGQLVSVGWSQRVAAPVSSFQRRLLWQNAAWSGTAPSEFRMLLTHAVSTTFWTRLMILVGTLSLVLSIGIHDEPTLITAIFGAALMGVTVFAGDQPQAAYQFFADRGVDWRRLLVAHALPALVLAMIPIVLVATINMTRLVSFYVAVGLITVGAAAFVLGMFCSICTRLSLLSMCLTVGAFIATCLAWAIQFNFYHLQLQNEPPLLTIVLLFVAETTVLCIATVVLLRRWLIYDRVQGAYYYLATITIGLVPTHLLAMGLCFLAIPNVPWQGAPLDQVRFRSTQPRVKLQTGVPFYMQNRLYTTDTGYARDAINLTIEHMRSMRSLLPKDALPPDSALGGPEQLTLDDITSELKKLELELDEIPAGSTVDPVAIRLSLYAESMAWIALYATQELKDVELARRAWKVNRQLLDLFDYSTTEGWDATNCRLVSALLRRHLSSSDWELLRSGGSLADIQPTPVDKETWSNLLRMQATVVRETLRHEPYANIFFPTRWYHERMLAAILQQEIEAVASPNNRTAPIGFLSAWPNSRDVRYIVSIEESLPR